ncbi:MAG: O-sialoglycoprotein endopeptidase [Bacillota bacterium]|jgi:N6-L-threonylcarbamoyladenine synthase
MSELCYLGVDTSCYTTSLALVDARGETLADQRMLLPVPAGGLGLRQSDGVFHHVRQLPQLLQRLPLAAMRLEAVGVSARPCPTGESYMPVFLAGVLAAQAVAVTRGVPLYRFSHQEGHISAGLTTTPDRPFLAVHISGGTSDLLLVQPDAAAGFQIQQLAGSSDLNAGQMIDRVGVALGLPFPAGPHLERLASAAEGRLKLPSAVADLSFSFSGPCSAALRLIGQGEDGQEVAYAVLRVVANSLEKVLRAAKLRFGISTALLVGGVLSNQLIRQRLSHRLDRAMQLVYAPPELCSDNAVGIARLARRQHQSQQLR